MSTVKLGDVAIESRDSLKEKDKSLPVVGLEHLIPEQIILTDWNIGQDNTFTKIFEKGDVLFGRRRAYLKKAAVAPCKGICSGDITVIRAKEVKILPELLPFVIQNDIFFDYAVGKSAGSLSPRVKWEHLANYEFNLPELDEQKKLSEVLWQIVATMESYKKLLAKTDEMVKAKYVEMFGDITNPNTTLYIEDGFVIRDDLRKPINDSERSTMKTGQLYPYFGANGIVDEINQFLTDSTILCIAEDCGEYGPGESSSYIIEGKAWINNHAHVLIPKDNCNIKYANIYFHLLDMRGYVSGTTRLKLTQGNLKKIPFILPPLELQNQFADFVQKSEESKAAIQSSLNSLSAVYKKIIAENLGGSN